MERKRLKHLTAPESKTVLLTEQNQSYKSFRSMSKKHESQLREFPMPKQEQFTQNKILLNYNPRVITPFKE